MCGKKGNKEKREMKRGKKVGNEMREMAKRDMRKRGR